jgi:hypothetical protein
MQHSPAELREGTAVLAPLMPSNKTLSPKPHLCLQPWGVALRSRVVAELERIVVVAGVADASQQRRQPVGLVQKAWGPPLCCSLQTQLEFLGLRVSTSITTQSWELGKGGGGGGSRSKGLCKSQSSRADAFRHRGLQSRRLWGRTQGFS